MSLLTSNICFFSTMALRFLQRSWRDRIYAPSVRDKDDYAPVASRAIVRQFNARDTARVAAIIAPLYFLPTTCSMLGCRRRMWHRLQQYPPFIFRTLCAMLSSCIYNCHGLFASTARGANALIENVLSDYLWAKSVALTSVLVGTSLIFDVSFQCR